MQENQKKTACQAGLCGDPIAGAAERAVRQIAGNTATGWLKIIALVFMFIDHAGKMLLPSLAWMRMLGRIAFPLYAWCLVVGFHYTRSAPKYILRVVLVGIISQPLYMIALNHTWREPNVFLTLALGLCALWGIREKKLLSQVWAPIAALALAVVLKCDYNWRGVALIILLYAAQDSRAAIAAVMTAFCLYWGSTSSTLSNFLGLDLAFLRSTEPFATLFSPWMKLQAMAILALPLMLIPMRKKMKMPWWLSYALYPAHLALLWLLEKLMGVR